MRELTESKQSEHAMHVLHARYERMRIHTQDISKGRLKVDISKFENFFNKTLLVQYFLLIQILQFSKIEKTHKMFNKFSKLDENKQNIHESISF